MAIDATLALPRTARQVPVTIHAAVRAVLIVAGLRRMALGTERLDVFVSQGPAIGQVETVVIRRIMAGAAFQSAMREMQALVKLLELLATLCLRI